MALIYFDGRDLEIPFSKQSRADVIYHLSNINGFTFRQSSHDDREYIAHSGGCEIKFFTTASFSRVWVTVDNVISLDNSKYFDRDEDYTMIPDVTQAIIFCQTRMKEINDRFPTADWLMSQIADPSIQVIRTIESNNRTVTGATYLVNYVATMSETLGGDTVTFEGNRYNTKGTSSDRFLKRIQKDLESIKLQGSQSFDDMCETRFYNQRVKDNEKAGKDLFRGFSNVRYKMATGDRVEFQIEIPAYRLEAFKQLLIDESFLK